MKRWIAFGLLLAGLRVAPGGTAISTAQDDSNQRAPAAISYYDFWPGTWHQVVDEVVEEEPRFEVQRGLHPNSFEELWHMDGYEAKAWRVWDETAERWRFVWISEEGHFQIWEERKVGEHWYMYKEFVIDGEPVLSRQAFLPQENGTVVRTSEHSRDGGETWKLRFREVLVEVP
ncbi:MAG: hypothetical protein R3244_04665 [Thermoanaerobaculia bacterium]|nr:hypothetical protein [Thermoanaerobaculia bacterium]